MSEEKPPELPSALQQPGEKKSGRKGCGCIGVIALSLFLFVASFYVALGGNEAAYVLYYMSFAPPVLWVLIWLSPKLRYKPPKEGATPAPEDEPEEAEQ